MLVQPKSSPSPTSSTAVIENAMMAALRGFMKIRQWPFGFIGTSRVEVNIHIHMGYDLHITRRKSWSDNDGPAITEAEWNALITAEPDLADALYWERGEIICKNPDEAMIDRMVALSEQLGAKVEGDDG